MRRPHLALHRNLHQPQYGCSYAKLHDFVQVELQSDTVLTFPSNTNTRTSSGTYLATATFTSGGNFLVVTQPLVNSSNNCGVFTSPQLQLAVLVAAVDYNVSCSLQISCWLPCSMQARYDWEVS